MLTTEDIDKLIAGEKPQILKEVKVMVGKGKKICPICKEVVGARSLKCVHCDHEFKPGEKYEPDLIKTPEQINDEAYCRGLGLKGRPIYSPSGPCPIKLKSFDTDSIYIWCEEVVDEGYSTKDVYFPSCLIYWLREFVDINSPEYEVLKGHVNNWANGIIQAFKE